MPENKEIEIDEIITVEKSTRDDQSRQQQSTQSQSTDFDPSPDPSNHFTDFEKTLPWKARWMLRLTRWFILLRRKTWGKIMIIMLAILAALLIIPLGFIFICFVTVRSLLKALR